MNSFCEVPVLRWTAAREEPWTFAEGDVLLEAR